MCLILGLLTVPVPSAAQDSGPIYIVQPGDTISALARRFGISQDVLVQSNNIVDPARLFPGDTLVIPGFPGIEGELTLRAIELGETVTSLSLLYGVNPLDLARLNRMVRLDAAYAGQSFVVPTEESDVAESEQPYPEITRSGETRLERSAQAGISPWDPGTGNVVPRFWLLPGSISIEKGQVRASALPSLLRALSITSLPLVQGKTVVVRVGDQEGYQLSGSLGDHQLQFSTNNDGSLIGLQGVHALMDPGLLDLAVEVRTEDSEDLIFGFNQRVLLSEGDYGFQILNGVPPETVDPAYTQPENDLIQALLAPKSETKLWDGAFDYPSRYYTEEFISVYGTRRNYNKGALLYYHTGLDFYGQNIPIYAPADGVVVFADSLTVRGNATYIDHGWGVYSGYLHQSEIHVEVGEPVERGQVIGQVGATGRVTGPHLHWEIWVGGVPVEPLDWVAEAIP
jgi:murein DD-endopeptidase MepM/ murein hydrolase activator NlpD